MKINNASEPLPEHIVRNPKAISHTPHSVTRKTLLHGSSSLQYRTEAYFFVRNLPPRIPDSDSGRQSKGSFAVCRIYKKNIFVAQRVPEPRHVVSKAPKYRPRLGVVPASFFCGFAKRIRNGIFSLTIRTVRHCRSCNDVFPLNRHLSFRSEPLFRQLNGLRAFGIRMLPQAESALQP